MMTNDMCYSDHIICCYYSYDTFIMKFIGVFLFYNLVLCEHRLTHNIKVILKF